MHCKDEKYCCVSIQVEYKLTYKLRSTEDAFAALEDNTVTLSTMKASKFFPVFEKEITQWEQTLSLVSEMIEMVLQVQRSWQYLENIFVGSEDIRKQLPHESVMFDIVNQTFTERMGQLKDLKNIVRACSHPGMLDAFNLMDAKLEKIQKSLENYLEAKRQQFPRFYFLSSDDLLEILGQAKDPQNVQSHLKKCFEGIKRLEMFAPGSEGRRQWESTSVFSPDGYGTDSSLSCMLMLPSQLDQLILNLSQLAFILQHLLSDVHVSHWLLCDCANTGYLSVNDHPCTMTRKGALAATLHKVAYGFCLILFSFKMTGINIAMRQLWKLTTMQD
jgi:hypothetical protein